MNIYRIADLDIGIETCSDFTKEYLKDYLTVADTYDFCISVTEQMLKYEASVAQDNAPEDYYEITAILRAICNIIVEKYNGFFLHCSCLEKDGEAYIFTAKSGTGKSTHARLWREVFRNNVTMINDDKPIVRFVDNKFYIYGTPWNGKHSISNNIKAPIKAIYFLSQAETNKCTKADTLTSVSKLLSQTVLPDNKSTMTKLLDMLESLCLNTTQFNLECNISHEAVLTAYNSIKE